ncbi:hypothetical protein FB45DRAFT_867497 [Roridomyces roridus]|uniref:Uncharacterized protein n=1 Tax=Roridomyces roridus TaxID=1738132 RepID=A0AAD7BQX9_9AGAR|nr:hypothetical protein FB45DRAFT_867497 [Roridomyces roridus]
MIAPWSCCQRGPSYGIPPSLIATIIRDYLPNITSLHFVLVDCPPTFWYWDMYTGFWLPCYNANDYPECLTTVHITFAYTTPPSPLLVGAPRGTFFPPRHPCDVPQLYRFTAVKRLVVREANTDFIAFLTEVCPELECIESTAEFGLEDLPPWVAKRFGDRMAFRRLVPTTAWGLDPSSSDLVRVFTPTVVTESPQQDETSHVPVALPKEDAQTTPRGSSDMAPTVVMESPQTEKTSDVPVALPKADAQPSPNRLNPMEPPHSEKARDIPVTLPKEDAQLCPAPKKQKKAFFWRIVGRLLRKRVGSVVALSALGPMVLPVTAVRAHAVAEAIPGIGGFMLQITTQKILDASMAEVVKRDQSATGGARPGSPVPSQYTLSHC